MKEARANDYWRGLYKKAHDTAVRQVSFRDIRGLGNGYVQFTGGISAICGGNGAGKTTLLEAVLKSVDAGASRVLGSARDRFDNSELVAAGHRDGVEINRAVFLGGELVLDDPLLDVTFLDSAAESTRLMQLLHTVSNFDELLEALSPRELTSDELEHISYLVGKSYTKCLVYEIEEFVDGGVFPGVFPYFQVTDVRATYGSEDMGLGEMALHIINWTLQRIAPNSVLLIEEPETHLAPRSQDALMNTLAQASLTNGLWIVLTTHAPAIVRRIPLEHISLVLRTATGTRVVNNPSRLQLNTVLGIPSRFEGLILVEDKAAREFVRAVLDRAAPDLVRLFQIIDVGDNGKVIAALRHFPAIADWFSMVGLLDGDQRGKKFKGTQWPIGFLPGEAGPERLLRSAADSNRVAEILGRDPNDVEVVLTELEGRDDHDWLESFPRLLGTAYEATMFALTACWFDTDGASVLAEQIASIIRDSAEG